jgi:hypothetical protein
MATKIENASATSREVPTSTSQQGILRISVFTTVGSLCVAAEDGDKLFNLLKRALQTDKSIELSFQGVELLSSPFLNSAIGRLVGEVSLDDLRARLTVVDISPDDRVLLQRVVENAKRYFNDPERYKDVREQAMQTL